MHWNSLVKTFLKRKKRIIYTIQETSIRKDENSEIKYRRKLEMRIVKRIQNESIRNSEKDRLHRKWHLENRKLDMKRVNEDIVLGLRKRLSTQKIKKKLEEKRRLRKLQRSIIRNKQKTTNSNTT